MRAAAVISLKALCAREPRAQEHGRASANIAVLPRRIDRASNMLMIFIDSNIFFNNWYLRNANFAVLANYLSNEGASLLLSEVVRQEVEAKFNAERDTLQKSLMKDLRRVEDFQQPPRPIVSPPFDDAFNFIEVVNDRFDSVELVGLDDVSNRDLVPRAINAKRPFRDGDGIRAATSLPSWHPATQFRRSCRLRRS